MLGRLVCALPLEEVFVLCIFVFDFFSAFAQPPELESLLLLVRPSSPNLKSLLNNALRLDLVRATILIECLGLDEPAHRNPASR